MPDLSHFPEKNTPDITVELNGGPYHGHVQTVPHNTESIVKMGVEGDLWTYAVSPLLRMAHCIGRSNTPDI